ncbi:MAG TPA: KGG domain-containing protein [Tepidisphaeraceae bacterium]|nr:KGG domain-containing protein [Tepidisphaeraceae bacterium]
MQTGTHNRGFASMNREKQREIARKGGKAAHEKGTAHEFTAVEARAAGRKGGERISANREHMSRIGRLGGKSSAGRRSAKNSPETNGNAAVPGNGKLRRASGQATQTMEETRSSTRQAE